MPREGGVNSLPGGQAKRARGTAPGRQEAPVPQRLRTVVLSPALVSSACIAWRGSPRTRQASSCLSYLPQRAAARHHWPFLFDAYSKPVSADGLAVTDDTTRLRILGSRLGGQKPGLRSSRHADLGGAEGPASIGHEPPSPGGSLDGITARFIMRQRGGVTARRVS
ncbi:MAG: hypothetical protein KatS3mg111_2553 [Pirellulaceae bacterium]|nr:MAG: hypothetical protein KatS3mg111_2553 [Pirellulaceae bacterium]